MPRLILIELIYHVVLWLNAFPLKNSGVSANLSPRELVIRHKLDFAKHCRAQFGSYCEVHDNPVPTNSMISRTTPAIVLGPTGNLQGTYKIFSLTTGKKIKRRNFSPYPMPDTVIARVEQYGKENALSGIFDFAGRNRVLFEWNDEVDECPEGILEEDDVLLYPSIAAELPGVALEHDMPQPSIKADINPHGRKEDEATRNANQEPFGVVGVEPAAGAITHAKDGEIDSDSNKEDDNGIIAIIDAPLPVAQDPLVLSDSSDDEPNDDDHTDDDSEDDNDDDPSFADAVAEQDDSGDDEDKKQEDQGVRVALVTYGISPGIKKFQQRGEAGVTKELTQMHDMDVFRPMMKDDLTRDERKKALASLMFLKEKRDQSVKARMCADGRGQRGDWSKQDTTSPTVSTESVFITTVIDAHEGRDVACFDIPGAFLHADSDEDITMILKGRLAKLMVQVAPNLYRKYITIDWKGKAILYVKMQKAIYGLLRSALLFYRKLVADLESTGFIINPYDPCVANKARL